ncbi:MAG: Ni/Fe-hydrogenase cytochrome b subunit [Ignavibacteriales bacterium]|nr:Ni/Fe-hydrogenase cytochrome b subunit [Ignavibacteriales bacterium]
MKNGILRHLTFWKIIGAIIVGFGLYSTYLRVTLGLGATTNLSDNFPWGMWIGFDILCGVGLAAGGFIICAISHIFHIKKYEPLIRPAILTAFLGYLLVILGLLYDLGRPLDVWHAIIMWNTHSVMFEVAWCVMLYTTVLFLEFSPIIFEKFKWNWLLNIVRKISTPIMMLGILLSTLHQSSLGSLFLIIPTKMHALWWSPLLPVYFYLSAIGVGFSVIIFESYLSARVFNKGLEMNLLTRIGLFSAIFIGVTFLIKLIDLTAYGKLGLILANTQESILFLAEILIGTLIPVAILLNKKLRETTHWLYISAVFIIAGFMFNRLNVSITAISGINNAGYFPSIYEIGVTMMLVVLGMWAFGFAVKYFDVFPVEEFEENEEDEILRPDQKELLAED